MNPLRPGLYALVDLDALGARDPVHFVDGVLRGARCAAVQLRAKRSSDAAALSIARALAWRCRRVGVPFFVNDRVDLAAASGADGAHLGQDDLDLERARQIAPGLMLGVSTHSIEQLERALPHRPDYVAFGPVFATASKARPDPVVGVEGLARAVAIAKGVPVVAIGGIDEVRAPTVRNAGAHAGAVISALVASDHALVVDSARALHRALGGD